jgi:phosphatidylglycerol:prolipoprotein diacylglycerol transferase
MIEELFEIGPVSVSPFGVMMVLAFLSAWAQLRWGLKRLAIGDDEDASAILLAAGIGGIGGAKLYYAILYQDPASLIERSGLVWYGGLMLGAAAVLVTARMRKLPLLSVVDASAPAMALGYAVGRIGCFLVGDDYGVPTDLPWGVSFPYGLPGPTTAGFMRREYGAAVAPEIAADELLRVHPTQLYETLACLLIWILGVWLIRRGSRPGTVTVTVISLMAAERFLVEFVRAKDDRLLGQFTVAQVISVVVMAFLGTVWWRLRQSPEEPPPGEDKPVSQGS